MFNPDLPIRSYKEDALDRANFSASLAQAILSYEMTDSFTIGLYGKWGSGKTSVVNMVEERINEAASQKNKKEPPLLIRFNPWIFSDQNQLVTQFFKQLSQALKKDVYHARLEAVGEALESYSDAFDIAALIPQVGIIGAIAAFLGRNIGKGAKRLAAAKNADIQKIKSEIIKGLSESPIKIIIIIDDIDRLSNVEIRSVFQLVKSLADFPNTIYLLAFDREIVVKALEEVQEGDGAAYLEKIVQVPFELPDANKSKIQSLYLDKMNKLLPDLSEEKFDKVYWTEVFHYGIKPYLFTIRDVIRLVNSFSIKYSMLKEETNIIDLIGITAIQVFEPDVYTQMVHYKDELCGALNDYGSVRDNEADKTKAACEKILEHLGRDRKDVIKELIFQMFPKTASSYNHYSARYYDGYKALRECHICNAKCFNTYFGLTLDDGKMSTRLAEYLLLVADKAQLINKLTEINGKGQINDFLEIIDAIFKPLQNTDKHRDRIPIILEVLYQYWNTFKDRDADQFFSFPFSWRLPFNTECLLHTYSEEQQRYIVMKSLFDNPAIDPYPLVIQLNSIEREHGRFTDKAEKPDEEKLFIPAHVLEFEQIFLRRMEHEAADGHLIDNPNFAALFYFWEKLDRISAENYIGGLADNELTLAKLIASLVGKGKAAGTIVYTIWTVNIKEMETYVNVADAYNKIAHFVSAKEFSDLPKAQQENLIAFLIAYEKRHEDLFDSITAKAINARISDINHKSIAASR